jgi:hypothetical protein
VERDVEREVERERKLRETEGEREGRRVIQVDRHTREGDMLHTSTYLKD